MSSLYGNDLSYKAEYGVFAGLDEAGRGALAGPVVVAACILDYSVTIEGLNDSKLLNPKKREQLYEEILSNAIAYHIVEISPEYIDAYNILQATLLGFEQAYQGLKVATSSCLIDGNKIPASLKGIAKPVIKGDQKHASIAAASILAKVHRDRLMTQLHEIYPQYGFAIHKGYGTRSHCQLFHSLGPCPIHRKSYHVPLW